MPYKDKRDLYKAQKRYRARKKRELEKMKEKLRLYEELYGPIEFEVV